MVRETQSTKLAAMSVDIGYIKQRIEGTQEGLCKLENRLVDAMKPIATKVDEHERYIQKTKGLIGGLVILCTTLGGGVIWTLQKISSIGGK